MNRVIPGVFGLGVAVLPACSVGNEVVLRDTGAPPWGTPAGGTTPEAFSVTTTWTEGGPCGDSVRIQIVDPLEVSDWNFGMSSGDYDGEDCMAGHVCHPITADHTLHQVPDCLARSVVPGSTTFFDASAEPTTYYLADGTACYAWGNDAAYYAGLGCDELM